MPQHFGKGAGETQPMKSGLVTINRRQGKGEKRFAPVMSPQEVEENEHPHVGEGNRDTVDTGSAGERVPVDGKTVARAEIEIDPTESHEERARAANRQTDTEPEILAALGNDRASLYLTPQPDAKASANAGQQPMIFAGSFPEGARVPSDLDPMPPEAEFSRLEMESVKAAVLALADEIDRRSGKGWPSARENVMGILYPQEETYGE